MKVTKTTQSFCIFLVIAILISSCASTTLLQTEPSFASIYIDGYQIGTTPFPYSDKKVTGSKTWITFKKEGYKDLEILLKRNEKFAWGAFIGGFYLIAPWFWTMKYYPGHHYILKLSGVTQVISAPDSSHYLKGEDEQIKITIDSIKRIIFLPEFIIHDLKSIENAERWSARTMTNPYPLVSTGYPYATNLNEGNDYFLVYFTLDRKRDIVYNLSNLWPIGQMSTTYDKNVWKEYFTKGTKHFPTCYLKDESGKLTSALIYRGLSGVTVNGCILSWNPNIVMDYVNQGKEFLIFQWPKNKTPIQIVFYYQHREESQKGNQFKNEQLTIDLVPHK